MPHSCAATSEDAQAIWRDGSHPIRKSNNRTVCSRLTALWRYINFVLLRMSMLDIKCEDHMKQKQCSLTLDGLCSREST